MGCGGVCAGVWVRVRVNPTWTTVAILQLIKAYHTISHGLCEAYLSLEHYL